MLGATHHRIPIEVREKLSLGSEAAKQLGEEFARVPGLDEFVILNTCNRVEFYGVARSEDSVDAVRRAFCSRQHFDPAEFARFCVDLRDVEAIQHLFEVAGGLDSQMLGETEIFGQVKEAYARAQEEGRTGAILNRVFQKTFHAAKQVRSETAISHGQVSVANVAVELAENIFGSLERTRILLVGAGEIGEKTARAFHSRGARSLTVSSRASDHAMELASQLGALVLPFELREQRLAEFDVLVCATSAPNTVISRQAVETAMHCRRAQPLLLIDLALPRDVEPEAGGVENIFLYNLDDLAKVAEENRRAREVQARKARSILEEKSRSLWGSLHRSDVPGCPEKRS
jgi:glutamyl-tRNA reductase